MSRDNHVELLQGTLDMLILRTLLLGPQHGQAIVQSIRQASQEALLVDAGSLYPALHRLLAREWIAAKWDKTANGRRAKFYRLTAVGRKQLRAKQTRWKRLVEAIGLVMNPSSGEA